MVKNIMASQPSLLSGTSQSATSSGSKKAVLNQPLTTSTHSSHAPSSSNNNDPQSSSSSSGDHNNHHYHHHQRVPPSRSKDALVLGQELIEASAFFPDKENASPLSPLSPAAAGSDPTRKPSYLKLSCAVSGYGKYSRYSSYKNIPTRSPFSSTSSLRSDLSSPDPAMPSLRSPGEDSGRGDRGVRSAGCSPLSGAAVMATALGNHGQSRGGGGALLLLPPAGALNGHHAMAPGIYPTGDPVKDGEYFLSFTTTEEERLSQQAKRVEGLMRSQDLPEEVNGRIRAALGKSNLLTTQKFQQFRDLCAQHMHPDPEDRVPLYEDLQGFWEMVKLQIDSVDDNFAEIDTMSQNGWKEIPHLPSRRSSASSSPKSGNVSQTSTPSATPGHTPGSKRRGLKPGSKDTPDSSPEHAQKIRSAAKARDEARKRMLAEKRAAMRQQQQDQQEAEGPAVEIFLPESGGKN